MQALARLAVCTLLPVLAACAGTPSRAPAPGAPAPLSATDALYQQLDQTTARYEAAQARIHQGDALRGQQEATAALDDLRAGASRCLALPGCDVERFVATLDGFLRSDAGSGANGNGATPEATNEAGEASPVIAAVPELARSVALLKGRELGDVIALNGPVKAALEAWLTQYRPNLIAAWENYQHLRHLMAPEYERAGLPEAILFGMLAQESGGKVHAVSRSGASGPLQFMPATGQRFGLRSVAGFDQRFDPALSARANAAYLNEQLAIFNNNLELVIGAYNGGEGAMRRRVAAAGGATSFWDPKIYYDMSQETREYVPMVLAAAWLFLHPERYNLRFPRVPGVPGSITLVRPASIAELTICLGQDAIAPGGWFRTLRNLNPQLDPQVQEPAGARLAVPAHLEKTYQRDCAAGHWPTLAADLHAAVVPQVPATRRAAAPSGKPRTYTVVKGDTVAGIARRSGCGSMHDIARINSLRAPHYPIRPGQVLKLGNCRR
ncbi:transglycosylase SLT domain-containing protein [Dokdonella sp.]|uniref:lytic transglycosylase domain-containing protein n=1 Tax=Dokdonella sp. TaxID=2291710 RepID=UPI0031C8CDC1|nr:transglycosylase SLT domain-containing protein [Dokdonella sp.]